MSVQNDLKRLKRILEDLAEHPMCVEICRYDGRQIKYIFMEGLNRAIKHYESEARRVKKYY